MQPNKITQPCIITCGGGKGGIGKSTMLTNIGTMLAKKGFSVGFFDADFSGANLHLCLGNKRPQRTLVDYLNGNLKHLQEIAEATAIPNTWLISGAIGNSALSNMLYAQKQKIIRNLPHLDADYVLVDLAAGTHHEVVDFFAHFQHSIMVTDSLPVSLENAYGYLKNGIIRSILQLFDKKEDIYGQLIHLIKSKSDNAFTTLPDMLTYLSTIYPNEIRNIRQYLSEKKIFIVINNVRTNNDISTCQRFIELVKKYIGLSLVYIGYCVFEPEMRRALHEMKPITFSNTPKHIQTCFEAITDNLIILTKGRAAL